jgi:hypothetical protein
MGQSLKVKSEEFKRKIASLDKEHAKDFKKVHHSIKRKLDFLRKLERKSGKETAQGLRKEPVSVAGRQFFATCLAINCKGAEEGAGQCSRYGL